MTPDYEPTIRKVCEITGHKEVHPYILCLCRELPEWGLVEEVNDLILRGFLTSPATLRAVFGDNDLEIYQSLEEAVTIPDWQYHGNNLVPLDLPGILNYYKEWLKV